jgi:hypothetical protein
MAPATTSTVFFPFLVSSRLFLIKFSLVFGYFHPILDIIRLLNAIPGGAFVREPDLEKQDVDGLSTLYVSTLWIRRCRMWMDSV